MSGNADMMKDTIVKEASWFAVLLFIGVVILPLSIYVVGKAVFGEYGAGGFGDFYGELLGKFFGGEPVVLFLLLSPYPVATVPPQSVGLPPRRASALDEPLAHAPRRVWKL
jgi:hypothetical protein